MAAKSAPTSNLFEIKIEINRLFDQLIDRVNKRREQLLSQVESFLSDYETYRQFSMGQIEPVGPTEGYVNFQIEDMPEEELSDEHTKKPLPKYTLSCGFEEIDRCIAELGEVERIAYRPPVPPKRSQSIQHQKANPLQIGGRGQKQGQFDKPRGIGITDNNIIVIADQGRQVVTMLTLTGSIVAEIKQDSPYGVCVHRESAYVSDLKKDCVCLYSITRKCLERTSRDRGVLVAPKGLDMDGVTSTLYIADSHKNCIVQMNKKLEYLGEFGSGVLNKPQDVKMHSREGMLCVLDQGEEGMVHVFSTEGHMVETITGINKPRVISTSFFCIDMRGNFVVSDTERHSITVFSSNGEVTRILGQEGERLGDLKYPRGICCRSADNRYLCASSNDSFSIQMF